MAGRPNKFKFSRGSAASYRRPGASDIAAVDNNIDSGAGLGGLAAAGLSVAVIGMVLIRLLMDNAGWVYAFLTSLGLGAHLAMGLMMFATFSPLWLGGLVGWAVGAGGRDVAPRARAAAAAAFAVPIALLDPWAIVALGAGSGVFFPLKLVFLSAPVLAAAVFAYSGWSGSRFQPAAGRQNVLFLVLLTATIYVVIYWLILPWGNVTAIPLVPR